MVEEIAEFHAIGVQDFEHWIEPKLFTYKPRPLRPYDIDIQVEACGICGSDTHTAKGDWGQPFTPMAVGHEIVGYIVRIGSEVDRKTFTIGQRVGVGAQCDSCGECWRCKHHFENNCPSGSGTYGSTAPDGYHTQGGYADYVRINSKFVFNIPEALETKYAAPLLCAGVTGFRPLLIGGVKKGSKVAVSGIGGVGHLTIQFAKALGAEVTAVSRNDRKRDIAKKLGADHYIATSSPDFPSKYKNSFDVIVNTASTFSEGHIQDVMSMMRPDGKFLFITMPKVGDKLVIDPFFLCSGNYQIGGSAIGSPNEIKKMLDIAAKHNIKPWIETYDINEENVSTAWKRLEKGDVRFRFVLTGYKKFFGKRAIED